MGEFVLWSDYARLKAECQSRQAENSVLAVECDSLKAEVERLTKAGDKMIEIMYEDEGMTGDNFGICARLWRAAKQGGQP